MTRIAAPDNADPLTKSPDRRCVWLVTRRGDLGTDENVFQLLVSCIPRDHTSFVARDDPAPLSGAIIAEFRTGGVRPAIERPEWTEYGRAVAFLGRPNGEPAQVYIARVRGGALTALTHETSEVTDFAMSEDGGTVVYSVHSAPENRRPIRGGYAIENRSITSSLTGLERQDPQSAFFAMNVKDGVPHKLREPVPPNSASIFVSPNGSYAVVSASLSQVPRRWCAFAIIANAVADQNGDGCASGASSIAIPSHGQALQWLRQLVLVDLSGLLTRGREVSSPLLDAPAYVNVKAWWASDDRSIILGPTFVPPEERARHGQRPFQSAFIDVAIMPQRVSIVSSSPPDSRVLSHQILGYDAIERLDDRSFLIRFREQSGVDGNRISGLRFRKSGNAWRATREPIPADSEELVVSQSLNSPPNIVLRNYKTRHELVAIELNPFLRQRALGDVRVFAWKDRIGREYVGGLIRPPGYDGKRRYPLVIQTYGFYSDLFLVDGANAEKTTAFAARALAAKNMLVLQMPNIDAVPREPNQSWDDYAENPMFAAAVDGAIDALASAGAVDPTRVGLIGFSHTGLNVLYEVTFSPHRIAAATIADSIAPTPWSYALQYGDGDAGMRAYEGTSGMGIGAPFFGCGIAKWVERSPIFHLDRIAAAVRLEVIGTEYPPAQWDMYAILRHMRRPVEMIHIPNDVHNLETPSGRYASLEGNVDWFTFWLKDEEDPDPRKAAQFARWRDFRRERRELSTARASFLQESPDYDQCCQVEHRTNDACLR